MRRALGLMLITGLLFTGVACGSSGDGDSKSSDGTENSSGETSSDNADVQAYCDAVDEFIDKYKDASANELSTMAADSKDLTAKAAALATADLSADDAQAVADCTKKSTDEITPG